MIPAGLLLATILATPACRPVDDRILARDLAADVPEFASLPADTVLGHAPIPGAVRMIRVPELERLANRYNLQIANPREICLERTVAALTTDKLLTAMRLHPEMAQARIELLEHSRYPVPAGEIVFPSEGLASNAQPNADAPVTWKGYIRYAQDRRFAIWGRVKIRLDQQRLVAVADLRPGQPIEAGQVRFENFAGAPARKQGIETLDQVVGRLPRRIIRAGSPILPGSIEDPPEVQRGEMVHVEVRSGATRLMLIGRAEAAGRRGESISIRNLESGRTFSARIADKGKVMVTDRGGSL
jgi:flagella basal body P-ring formation protein FlgA